jgi:prepilin-type processing-associated H-X9-DG protein
VLVVVSIIALLAAILFPVFARARENARRASCQSNMKQIALGIRQYAQDFDNVLPPFNAVGSDGIGWAAGIQPYLKSTQVLQCPSDTRGSDSNPANIGYNDYWYNHFLNYDSSSTTASFKPRHEADIPFPANTLLNGDGNGDGTQSNGTSLADCNSNSTCGAGKAYYKMKGEGTWGWFDLNVVKTPRTHVTKHFNGANYSFVDGHVKWLSAESLSASYNQSPNGNNATFRVQ